MYTNIGLVDHAIKALNEGWQYVYGTIGQVLTNTILAQKQTQYPDQISKYIDTIKTYIGRRTVDCVNLIKSYLWWDSAKNDVVYDIKYDKFNGTWMSADGAFSIATEKGPIETMPDIPGICVRYPGHIGVYIGNGEVIEARGTKYGVVKTLLKDRGWTHWLKYPGIEYLDAESDLLIFQKAAKFVGIYTGEVDNIVGPKTRAAAEEFMRFSLQILNHQDPRELADEIMRLKNDMRLIKDIADNW